MKQITWNNRRGMTLTELLAVLLILSLLTTIAVPVYVARQEDARVRVAMADCRNIAQAEDMVATMHGFYVPFQLLDELPSDRDPIGDDERIDELAGYADNLYLINPTIEAVDQLGNQAAMNLRLSAGYPGSTSPNPLVRKMVLNWGGPFLSFQRFWYDTTAGAGYDGPSDPRYKLSQDMFRDFPLDPWGNPYRFYSNIGVIGSGNDEQGLDFDFDNPNSNFSNGELTTRDQDRFDRYAVVSFGRDGMSDLEVPNPQNTPDNDIFYEFGTDGVSRNFGKF